MNAELLLDRNEVLRAIRDRHSIRQFTDEPVKQEDIEALLHAANSAPSAHNLQSWKFIVIRNEKKRELEELIYKRSNDFPRPACALLRMASRTIAQAPVVFAVANTGELIKHGTSLFSIETEMAADFFRTMEIQSSAAAVENMLIAAKSLGLDSVWLGIMFLIKDQVLELLGEPQGEFMAVVPVGYALRPTEGPRKRPIEVTVKIMD